MDMMHKIAVYKISEDIRTPWHWVCPNEKCSPYAQAYMVWETALREANNHMTWHAARERNERFH